MIIGGAQENTLHTCRDQAELHGDQVTLITGPSEGPEGSLLERTERIPFSTILVPDLIRSIRPVRDWKALRQLTRLLRELRPDIVHTHSSKAGILGRLATSRLGIPVVHTIHGAAFHYGQSLVAYRSYVALERLAARWTDRFISVCDDMTREYVEAGVADPERFTTVYSGFDVEPFLAPPRDPELIRSEWGFSTGEVVVGKIGRLFHLKGHEFVLRAAPAIISRAPQVRFLFVGDGILRDTFEREIRAAGLERHFVFTGLVPPTRIPELMHAMDIVVHTSQWEGLARVLPQGLVAAKPVISFDVGGAREVVIPGETGFLLPRDSVDELAQAVVTLAGDAELRRRLGEKGRELCAERFRHQFMTDRIREVYRRVLTNRS